MDGESGERRRGSLGRALRGVLLLAALATPLLAGCVSADINGSTIAKGPARYDGAPVPISVSVAAFKGGKLPEYDRVVSTSFLNVLDETHLFQGVYTEAEAPDSEVRFEGTVRKVGVHENYWWMVLYVSTGVVTYGIAAAVEALAGVPYLSESGNVALELRAIERRTNQTIATYDIDWADTQFYNVYIERPTAERYAENPRYAMQLAMNQTVESIARDVARYQAVAPRTPAKPPAAPPGAPPPPHEAPPAPPPGAPPPGGAEAQAPPPAPIPAQAPPPRR